MFAFSSTSVRSRDLDGLKRSVELAVDSDAKIAAYTEARWLFAMISYHFHSKLPLSLPLALLASHVLKVPCAHTDRCIDRLCNIFLPIFAILG